jgi:pimeloyl-ACP methyl ester carboxylesterase
LAPRANRAPRITPKRPIYSPREQDTTISQRDAADFHYWYRANAPLERLVATPPTLVSIAAPTLGVWTLKDPYVLEERLLNSARTVTGPWLYERFDDAGHWGPLDQPDKFNRLLQPEQEAMNA